MCRFFLPGTGFRMDSGKWADWRASSGEVRLTSSRCPGPGRCRTTRVPVTHGTARPAACVQAPTKPPVPAMPPAPVQGQNCHSVRRPHGAPRHARGQPAELCSSGSRTASSRVSHHSPHQLIGVRGPGQKSAPAGSLQGSCKGVQRNGHHGTTAQFIQSFESELVMTASKLQKPCIFPQRHLQYHISMYVRTVRIWGGGIQ